jgi:thymidylate synthase ThyX
MVRQRTAVYAQESLRFAVKEQIAARPGPIISQSKATRREWNEVIQQIWGGYRWLIANGVPAEEARGLLPHDTLTRLNYKTNLRNLLEHAGNRLCTQAQFEWRMVFIDLVRAISEHRPHNWQWQHIVDTKVFKPVCFQLGHCPFTADFDRGCKIRPRVEAGRFDEIKPVEYMGDPTAAWQ